MKCKSCSAELKHSVCDYCHTFCDSQYGIDRKGIHLTYIDVANMSGKEVKVLVKKYETFLKDRVEFNPVTLGQDVYLEGKR